MDATGNFGMNDCKVFVGGLPRDADKETVMEEMRGWEGVVQIYYRGPGTGWATVEFSSERRRDDFLKHRERYNKILNVRVDIKKFEEPKKGLAKAPSSSSSVPSNPPAIPSFAQHRAPFPASSNLPGHAFRTGSVQEFVLGKEDTFGVIRAPSSPRDVKLVFHVTSTFYCRTHRLMCNVARCNDYYKLPRQMPVSLREILPPGTQVNFLHREIAYKEIPFDYQATVVWPFNSYRPTDENVASFELDTLLLEYMQTSSSKTSAGPKPFANVKESTPPFSRPQEEGAGYARSDDDISGAVGGSTTSRQSSAQGSNGAIGADVDKFLENLELLKIFLEEQFGAAGLNEEDVNVLPLACKLLKSAVSFTASGKSNKLASAKGLLSIRQFLKEKDVVVDPSKETMIFTNYKKYYEILSNRLKRDIQNPEQAERALEQMARKINVQKTGGTGDNVSQSESSSSNRATINKIPSGDGQVRTEVVEKESGATSKKDSTLSVDPCPNFVIPSGRFSCAPDLSPVQSFSSPPNSRYVDKTELSANHLNQHLTKWLEDTHIPEMSRVSVYPLARDAVVTAVIHVWMESRKPPLLLKEDLRKSLGHPRSLLQEWASLAEKAWFNYNSAEPCVAVDAVVRATATYCWSSLSQSIPQAQLQGDAYEKFQHLIVDTSYSSPEGNHYGLRGVVVRGCGDHIGIALTEQGPVFFEKNIAYVQTTGSGKRHWTKCDSLSRQIPPGSFVKLHSVAGKASKRCKVSYHYATKVWMPTSENAKEPVTGPEVPGGKLYWRETIAEFEKVLKVNPELGAADESEARSSLDHQKLYEEAFEHHLQDRFAIDLRRKNLDASDYESQEKVSSSYATFLNYYLNSRKTGGRQFSREELVNTLKILYKVGVGFFDLRKSFVACNVMQVGDLFKESVELTLVLAPPTVLTSVDCASVVNVAPLLARFFAEADPVAEGQIQEIKKCLGHTAKGSIQFASELYVKVSSLQKPYSGNSASGETTSSAGSNSERRKSDTPDNWYDTDGDGDGNGDDADESSGEDGNEDDDSGSHGESNAEDGNSRVDSDDKVVIVNGDTDDSDPGRADEVVPPPKETQAALSSQRYQQMIDAVYQMRSRIEYLERYVSEQDQRVKQLEAWRNKVETSLREEIRNLIDQVKAMKQNSKDTGSKHAPGRQMVKIAQQVGGDLYEFSTSDEGVLSAESVRAVFAGANALKYRKESGAIRVCSLVGNNFDVPEDGWGERVYIVNVPGAPGAAVAAAAAAGAMGHLGRTFSGSHPGSVPVSMGPTPLGFPGAPQAPGIPLRLSGPGFFGPRTGNY